MLKAVRDANASTATAHHQTPGLERLESKFDALRVDLEKTLASFQVSFLSQIPSLIQCLQSLTSSPETTDDREPESAPIYPKNQDGVPTACPPTDQGTTAPPPPSVAPTLPLTPPHLPPAGSAGPHGSVSPPPAPPLSPRPRSSPPLTSISTVIHNIYTKQTH